MVSGIYKGREVVMKAVRPGGAAATEGALEELVNERNILERLAPLQGALSVRGLDIFASAHGTSTIACPYSGLSSC